MEAITQDDMNKKIVQTLIEQLELLNKYLNESDSLLEKLLIHDRIMKTTQTMISISSF